MTRRPTLSALFTILLLNQTTLAAGQPAERSLPQPTVKRSTADDGSTRLRRGHELFREHCAQCHGPRAEGAPDWRKRQADGLFPPPPLNGSGHAWHHPASELKEVIIFGRNRMPAWNGKLGRQEVDDLIAWFQSLWPKETYQVWAEADRRAQTR